MGGNSTLRQMGPQCWAGLKTRHQEVSAKALQVRAQDLMLRPPLCSFAPDHLCSTLTGELSAPAAAATLLALPTRPSWLPHHRHPAAPHLFTTMTSLPAVSIATAHVLHINGSSSDSSCQRHTHCPGPQHATGSTSRQGQLLRSGPRLYMCPAPGARLRLALHYPLNCMFKAQHHTGHV